jgi:putative ABC transport system ATP-binding protein
MEPMIRVEGLTRRYRMGDAEVAALAGVDLRIAAGEFVALMGPSGSGKSTFLNLLGCLDTPSDGQYWLGGEAVAGLDDERLAEVRNRAIGFIFQSFHLLPRLSALDNVLLPLRFAWAEDAQAPARARTLLERLGLGHRIEHRPLELSGGQRQRVAIARALINRPRILLADEPTGNLDSRTTAEILDLLGELHGEGQTIVLVTHEDEVAQCAQRVVRMRDGRIESDVRH